MNPASAAGILGLVLALVVAVLAMGEVSALQDLSRTVTTGATSELMGAAQLLALLVVVVIGVGVIGGVVMWMFKH